jgi:pimeloyl-ACP methyl ester carboxylesterase
VVVTLGSPFGGSPWAALLPTASLVRALRPGSPLLRRLAAFPPPAGVRWLAFASTLDPIVPADRAVPAHRQATCVTVDGVGHTGMLLDRDVIARILAAIQVTGEATDEGDVRAA